MKLMIGLKSGTVKLCHHSTSWRGRFLRESTRLRRRLGRVRYTLEHIGSTAVPGLDAKPIIDLAMQIPSFRQLPLWIRRLEAAGYEYKGEYGLSGRHFFTAGNPVVHHLHLVAKGCRHWERWILFRDYLQSNPVAAKRYNTLKKSLARRHADNRKAYTRGKTPLVDALLKQARKWAALTPANDRQTPSQERSPD